MVREFKFELWDGQAGNSVEIHGCIDTWNNKTKKDKELTQKHIQECIQNAIDRAEEFDKKMKK